MPHVKPCWSNHLGLEIFTTYLLSGAVLAMVWFAGSCVYPAPAHSETYLAVSGGLPLTSTLRTGQDGQESITRGVKVGPTYGVALGHYSDQHNWLGVELAASQTRLLLTQDTVTTNPFLVPPQQPATLYGRQLDVTAISLSLLLRDKGETWTPYLGVGVDYLIAKLQGIDPSYFGQAYHATGQDRTTTGFGIHAKAGLDYRMASHWSVFGEYGITSADLRFSGSVPGLNNLNNYNSDAADRISYLVQVASMGVRYGF